MNDRYLFRGKDRNDGNWNIGFLTADRFGTNEEQYFITDKITGYHALVIPETVGQCTGLKDKNGKLIFEGDVCESRASENQEDWKKWVVGFSDGSFCFNRKIPKKRKHKYEENLLCVDEIELYGLEIIGSIHDNPELLEVKE